MHRTTRRQLVSDRSAWRPACKAYMALFITSQIGRALVIAGVASMAIACFDAKSFIAK